MVSKYLKRSLGELDQVLEEILSRNPDFITELDKIIKPDQTQIQEPIMKFSELEELINNYCAAKYSPSRSHIKIGCDCGCGGNQYTRESWDEEEAQAQKDIDIMKQWCYNNNIEWDGVE